VINTLKTATRIQFKLYSCWAATRDLLVYMYVNVDVGQLTHAAVMDTSVLGFNTLDHTGPTITTVCSENQTVIEMTC